MTKRKTTEQDESKPETLIYSLRIS
jgi:hypothetical protein